MKLRAIVVLLVLHLTSTSNAEKLNERHVQHKRQIMGSATITSRPPLDTSTTIPPLASISLGMPTKAPPSFTNTFKPGATPPVSGAPVLPTALVLGSWPVQDKTPDINSPEVKAWMKELDGFYIPDIPPTKDGTCAGDPAAAAESAKHGWWTCGGYTRSTDIVACPDKLTWGVSFDDGPSPYTPILLKKLKDNDVKVTFFVIGSRVIERPGVLIDEYMNGHEISVHTWSHASLTSLSNAQIVAELGWTRKAIKAVLGVTPTTMRPPKGDIDDRVRAISLAMGLVPILWTSTSDGGKFDSNDWRVAGGSVNASYSYQSFQDILKNGTTFNTGFITLQHDLFEVTVDLAVGYTLDAAISHKPKLDMMPVGECMKYPTENLYRETTKNATFPHKNITIDIDGDGSTSDGFTNPIPFLGALSMAGIALLCALS